MQQLYQNKVTIHILGWAAFILAPFLLSPGPGFRNLIEPEMVASSLIRNFSLMGLFYLNLFYLTPVFLKNNGTKVFILTLLALVALISFTNWWVHETFTGHFDFRPGRMPPPGGLGPRPNRPPPMLPGPVFTNFLITFIVAITSTTIVMWNDWTKARAEEQERTLQKVASELAILKLQVSPHFLFNTLNNIRWLVRSKSDKAEEAVIKLSQLLRYILYQTNHDKVPVGKEIEHLKDFVSLQQMRLTNEQSMAFSCTIDKEDNLIVPLLFIPIIENFFKYGDFNTSFQNKIDLKLSNGMLVFRTENAIVTQTDKKTNEESGIGLANVRKRLALNYPDKSLLKVSESAGIFKLEMEII